MKGRVGDANVFCCRWRQSCVCVECGHGTETKTGFVCRLKPLPTCQLSRADEKRKGVSRRCNAIESQTLTCFIAQTMPQTKYRPRNVWCAHTQIQFEYTRFVPNVTLKNQLVFGRSTQLLTGGLLSAPPWTLRGMV